MSTVQSLPAAKKPGLSPRQLFLRLFEVLMIAVALIFIFPTIFVLMNSFKPTAEIQLNPVGLTSQPTFENFLRVLQTEGAGGMTFFKALSQTFMLTVLSVAGIILVSSMAAYILVRSKSRISLGVFFLFAFFFVIPFQTIMVSLVVLLADLQISNILQLSIVYIGLGVPSAVFMYHGFIKGVPVSLEESAAIDGAGTFRLFFQIVFPLLTPITATIAILDIIWVWNDFLLPYITMRSGTLVLFQFNFFGAFKKDYGALTASLVLTATPVVVLYIALQKYIIKGISAGAVKG